ncbi:MAG: hypothetical protein JWR58_5695, partial [Pseudonocardia sp.]|nr:hypothetical protein [Pseudonocardia sp.]
GSISAHINPGSPLYSPAPWPITNAFELQISHFKNHISSKS